LARPLHAHLERRHARTRQPRHLFVFEILDVLEEKRFPIFRRQPRQRPAHYVFPLGLLGGARVGDAVERGFVAHEDAPALRRPCAAPGRPMLAGPSAGVTRAGESRYPKAGCRPAPKRNPMSKRITRYVVAAALFAGCYQDDASVTAALAVRPQITVRLTDAPFPYASL